jgi:hypothetical protein
MNLLGTDARWPRTASAENAVEQTIKCFVKMLCGVLELFDRSPTFSSTGHPNKIFEKTNGAES